MKRKFKIIAKDSNNTTVSVEVTLTASKYVLVASEQQAMRERLRNTAFEMLRKEGYDVSEIKVF